MADTWFYASTLPLNIPQSLKNVAKVTTNTLGDELWWFEICRDGEYIGWVNINPVTGTIEFGEPAA